MNIPCVLSIADALQPWKAAHSRLVDAINAYAIACSDLASCFSQACPSFFEDHRDFDAALQSVQDELSTFERHKQTLESGLSYLNRARNLSFTLVPINILPQSLLLSVFSYFIDPEYAKRTYLPSPKPNQSDPALTIFSVCASWRNLALATPSVWSTIFFHPKDRENQLAQVFLARAGDALLDIQAAFPKTLDSYDWLPLLRPRYGQIRSLDLVLPNMGLLRTILAMWPPDSPAPSLKTLSIKVTKTMYRTDAAPPKLAPDETHDRFLWNLTSFSLYGGYFDWDSAAFIGLEHLRVAWVVDPGPTLGEVVGMLRASPRLRTLSLAGMPISQEENTNHPPVHLEYLQRLSLMTLRERDFCALVPLLLPGSQPLTLHLKNVLDNDLAIELCSKLFRRSNVQSLYLHSRIARQTMSDIFPALEHLGHLYCSHNDMGDVLETLSAPLPTGSSKTPSLPPCPHLRTLHFHRCEFKATPERLKRLITNQPTLTVKFQDCLLSHPAKFPRSELAPEQILLKYGYSRILGEPALEGVDHTRVHVVRMDEAFHGLNMISLSLLED